MLSLTSALFAPCLQFAPNPACDLLSALFVVPPNLLIHLLKQVPGLCERSRSLLPHNHLLVSLLLLEPGLQLGVFELSIC